MFVASDCKKLLRTVFLKPCLPARPGYERKLLKLLLKVMRSIRTISSRRKSDVKSFNCSKLSGVVNTNRILWKTFFSSPYIMRIVCFFEVRVFLSQTAVWEPLRQRHSGSCPIAMKSSLNARALCLDAPLRRHTHSYHNQIWIKFSAIMEPTNRTKMSETVSRCLHNACLKTHAFLKF